jgi:hypothetical protein
MQRIVKITIIFTLLFIFGCKKDNPDPVPPIITFMDAQLSPDKTYNIVRFEFFDGDGDLGLKQNENSGEQEFNLFIDYYEKNNGTWELKSPVVTWNTSENKFDTTELHLRVPFIENEAGGELKGETSVDLFYDYNADTIKYELTLKDRALHSSNTITTSEIIVN